uniref:Uncharacterized protein n=1 Tax=Arundo donax TaxID=35708 RepID=A0A0A9AS60_ARUDO
MHRAALCFKHPQGYNWGAFQGDSFEFNSPLLKVPNFTMN